ncbi:MAG: transketolase family protein [Acidobacteriia bacterium]|nr:transketolase family protein [Terriglobia bacterium]
MITPASAIDLKAGNLVAIRQAFGPAFEALAETDKRLVAVTADLGGSVNLARFGEQNPSRYFNCGVAETNMIGMSAGLAMAGYIPYAVTFGAFLGRAMDHVRQSIGHNKLKVNVVGSHGGISNGKDGPSAHAIEDVAFFRSTPPFAVVVVADANQIPSALQASVDYPNPVYLRLYREPTAVFYEKNPPFSIGKANVLRKGSDITLVTCGPHVGYCQRWMDVWSKDVSIELIDSHTVKPLDEEVLLESAARTGAVVTVEDHYVNGGLGSAVAELLSERRPTPLQRVGLQGYAASGPYYELLEHAGIGERAVRDAIEAVLRRKRS